jgi:hypothetical protein
MISLIFLIAALICAILAAFVYPNPQPARPQLGWLAFALYLASVLAGQLPTLQGLRH